MISKQAKSNRYPDQRVGSGSEFEQLLASEQRRSERSGRPYVILRLTLGDPYSLSAATVLPLLPLVCAGLRSTDWITWHEANFTLGVICTETGTCDGAAAGAAIVARIRQLLATSLPAEIMSGVRFSIETSSPQGANPRTSELEADRTEEKEFAF